MRQKVSATTPISSMQGVERGSRVFIVPRHAGHDQRALRPRVAWSAAISPAGPPSTGLTFEKAQWTSSTPPGCTPRAWVGRSVELGRPVGQAWESYHSPHQSRNSGGRKTQGFQKVEKPCRAIGEEPSLPPSSAKIVRRKGSIFLWGFHSGSAAGRQTRKRKRLCGNRGAKRPPLPHPSGMKGSFMVSSRGGCPGCAAGR